MSTSIPRDGENTLNEPCRILVAEDETLIRMDLVEMLTVA